MAIDAYRLGEAWRVRVSGGAEETDVDAVAWAARAAELGAGEVLLTSIDRDGTRNGYDVELLRTVTEVVDVPVIASGGAGRPADFLSAFRAGASGALAASLFHSRELTILELKRWLASQGAQVRSVTGSDRSMRTNG